MESLSKITLFGLKMTVKNGLAEQFILEFLHVHKSEDFAQKFKLGSKNDMMCAWRDLKKNCGMCTHYT